MVQRPARERLAHERAAGAAARAAEGRRKKRIAIVVPVVVVLVIVAALVVVELSTGSSDRKVGAGPGAALDLVVSEVTGVPAAVSAAVGVGTARVAPRALPGAPPLTFGGLPRVFYAGAEYCPYCAAERWALVVALSRFGAFTGLGQTTSSPTDVYPKTASLSFYGSTFSGNVIAFTPYELFSNALVDGRHATLQTLSAADDALVAKYDGPPYFPQSGAIPFVDIGGKYLISGASYDPQVLHGRTQGQIAAALTDASSPITQAIVGTANLITAAVCSITNGAPVAVCAASWVAAAAAKLASVNAG